MISSLLSLSLHNARVLLRVDLNFDPNENPHYRLLSLTQTLKLLHERGAHTLLVTHRGQTEEKLSTRGLIPLLTAQGFLAVFAQTIEEADNLLNTHTLVVLQNIRLWPGETAAQNSSERKELARQLRDITQAYVTEAFAALHRPDCSIIDLPLLYNKHERAIGFLVERELCALTPLRTNPVRPFVVFVGGAKIATKLPMVSDLLKHADTVMCLPALSFMLDQARGLAIGASLVDEKSAAIAHDICTHAHLITPEDYLVTYKTVNGPITYVSAGHIKPDQIGISIGPKTVNQCLTQMSNAKTVFFVGACGLPARMQTMHEVHTLIKALPNSTRISILAGGDTVGVVQSWGLLDHFSFVSTGGSASLAYVAGQDLVGLAPF